MVKLPASTSRLFAIVVFIMTAVSSAVVAKQITIVASFLPGHFDMNAQGREAEIIRTTLQTCNHTVDFIVQPFTRHWDTFKSHSHVDGVTTVPDGMEIEGFRSVPYIKFHNGVTVLVNSGLLPEKLTDLKNQRVISFLGAKEILPKLKEASEVFESYAEKTDQLSQNRLLFGKRVDAVIGDGLLFADHTIQLRDESQYRTLGFDPNQQVRFLAIFDPTPYSMVFREQSIQQDFNRCYGQLKQAGKIDEINDRHIAKYREFVGSSYQGM